MGGGTEAFLELGEHCEIDDCNQLDFLPFTCNGCRKVFCLEHRTYRSHGCPRADHGSRTVAVCEVCSSSIEKADGEDDKAALVRHAGSGTCDASKQCRPRERCPVPWCREALTFSNRITCKFCKLNVCLKHRFQSDHACGMAMLPPRTRSGLGCRDREKGVAATTCIALMKDLEMK